VPDDPHARPVIALVTDFGAGSAWVGAMKGVILRALPGAEVVDLAHDVPPQDVRAGAFLLESAYRYFPAGTVHLAVVDPGVGGPRRLIAADAGGFRFLGPDNGLLAPALAHAGGARVVEVSEDAALAAAGRALPEGAVTSATFHGRDRFAPLAALMAEGIDLSELGAEVADWLRPGLPAPVRGASGEVAGEILFADRFGNLVTNLRPEDLPASDVVIAVGGGEIRGLARTYVEVAAGELLALVGSAGRIEVSVREGSAAARLAAGAGTPVTVRPARGGACQGSA